MKKVVTVCPYCASGCKINLVVDNGKIVRAEAAQVMLAVEIMDTAFINSISKWKIGMRCLPRCGSPSTRMSAILARGEMTLPLNSNWVSIVLPPSI
ncbi:hypothetical protein KQ096_004644 [Salmonella enterica]|nr:hypothetical protein [Salmonella enterica]EID6667134.1 hypothetical protein [Salmonella enterica]EJC4647769.1 hypothetical protein [Salmonella enterica]EKQ9926941.1 hypothetical protein [Salmonella enterica subsp. enterica serovar Panama]